MNYLQKLGKSLMLPVSVLPICGILMGIGYLLCPEAMQGGDIAGALPTAGLVMIKAGGAIINNMSWLFVLGVSIGMSDDKNGAVCLAGLVSWLIVITLLSPEVVSLIITDLTETSTTYLAFSKIQNPFIAIMCGILASTCYNRYKKTKLPDYLAFFSGRRFVVIISTVMTLLLVVVLAIAWPILFGGLIVLGKAILNLDGVGAGLYVFLNRLLIPLGLHHALNNVFWFDTIGIGDLTNFWAGKVSADVGWDLGMYMSGFFPCMMFGIWGAALAMIKNAKHKAKIKGMLLSAAICAFICGVTEPFEFMFMYAAFPLYVIYSLLYGIFTVIVYYVGFRAGFSFSAGATDLLFSSSLPASQNTWMIIPLGIAAFAVFFFVFDFAIKKFNFVTPGREDEAEGVIKSSVSAPAIGNSDTDKARALIKALGGATNITGIDCCATRLRMQLKDSALVDKTACKAAGAFGVVIPNSESCQVIIGVSVQQVCDAMQTCLSEPQDSSKRVHVNHTDIIVGQNRDDGIDADSYQIKDPSGIHARPAGKIATISGKYACEIKLISADREADAKSILSIMSLGIKPGDVIKITASGEDKESAVTEVMNYIRNNL